MTAEPCAFHEAFMGQIKDSLVEIKEQMRNGIEALNRQSAVFQETIARIVEAQTARRELCSRQGQRIETLEENQSKHREDHGAQREEYLTERADMWAAVNKLRFHVYVGLGVGIVLQILGPLVLGWMLKGGA